MKTKSHAPIILVGTLAFGLLLSGCSGADAPQPSDTSAPPAQSTDESTSSDPTDSTKGTLGSADGSVDEMRDGTWKVGDAGEVEFTAQNGALSLAEVRPADGWEQRVTDEKPDEIEVHFTRGDEEWKFEVEIESGGLQISKELKIRDGQSSDVTVGSAATLSFTVDGSTLSVADIIPAEGWTVVKQDESADDIEIGFQNADGSGKAEFEAEVETGGVVIEISQKLHGALG